MTSKIFYLKLLRDMIKRRIWYGAGIFLLLFISMPLAAMLSLKSETELYYYSFMDLNYELEQQKFQLVEWVSGGNAFLVCLIIGIALLGAWTGLSWFHSRKKMDLYGSLPVRREILFGIESISTTILFVVPYICNMFLTLLVGMTKGLFTWRALKQGIYGIGVYLLGFWAIYLCAAIAMLLTGKIITGILGTMVFLVIGPLMYWLLAALPDIFFDTYVSHSLALEFLLPYLSPAGSFINQVIKISSYLSIPNDFDWIPSVVLVFTVVLELAISVWLVRIRPAEGAEQSMVFPKTEGLIKAMILYPMGIGGGIFFWEIGSSRGADGWFWFGIVFVMAIVSILIEIIYHYDRKRLFEHKWSSGIALIAVLITGAIFKLDIFKYDQWIPDREDVENATMFYRYYWGEYPDDITNSEEYLLAHLDELQGDCVFELAEEGIANLEWKEAAENGDAEARERWENQQITYLTIVYKMKDGSVKQRWYRVSVESADAAEKELYQEQIFKEAHLPILFEEDGTCQFSEINGIALDYLTKSEMIELANIYKEELRALDYEQIHAEDSREVTICRLTGEWLGGDYLLNENFVITNAYLESVKKK